MKGFDDIPRGENPNTATFTDQMRRNAYNQTAEALRDSLLTWLSEGIASQDISRAFGEAVSGAVHKTTAGEMQSPGTQAAISEAVAKGIKAALKDAVSVENIATGVLKSLEYSWQAAVTKAVEREVAGFFNRSQVQNEVMSIIAKEVGNTISDVMDSRRGIVEKAVSDAAINALSEMDISSPLVAAAKATIRSNMARAASDEQPAGIANRKDESGATRPKTRAGNRTAPAAAPSQVQLRPAVSEDALNRAWDNSMPWFIHRRWPDFADFETEYRPFQNVPATGLKPLKRRFLISALSAAARGLKGDLAENHSALNPKQIDALKAWKPGEWYRFFKNRQNILRHTLSGLKALNTESFLKTINLAPQEIRSITTGQVVKALRETIEERAIRFGADKDISETAQWTTGGDSGGGPGVSGNDGQDVNDLEAYERRGA